ncbi:Mago (nucleomorph) [Bigelowiella natans]|uniref:Mago n=1 Tax=Bigelowiella natans TaxID=227086 RepID=Q3LW06_BIGNA|nr:Mago [Bigelowiella natans]ABA27360.1 Mago [Bigelowiella natans]|mmetsp:Transcript_5976/g.7284  ORF Transcript_5976/g.7284 Transcript_5976/m.7284 type:complete len:149 (+) Transcript_5976:19-465(+)
MESLNYLRISSLFLGSVSKEIEEIELNSEGEINYFNYSSGKSSNLNLKKIKTCSLLMNIISHIIIYHEILRETDKSWIRNDKTGFQELEILYRNRHFSFKSSNLIPFYKSFYSRDPYGLQKFSKLYIELKYLLILLYKLHFIPSIYKL